MNKALLIFFLSITCLIQAQSLIPFQDNDGKWGLKSQNKIIIKAEYDLIDSAGYGGFDLFKHDVLAAIVNRKGEIVFQPSASLLKKSNAFLRYYYNEYNESGSLQGNIDSSLFIYIVNAEVDTIAYFDSVMIDNLENDEISFEKVYHASAEVLTDGKIYVLNSKGKQLNKKPLDNLALRILIRFDGLASRESDEVYNDLFLLKDKNRELFGIYPSLPNINFGVMPFQQDGRWGVLNKEDGIIIKAIYDSLELSSFYTLTFYNNGILVAIVDQWGNYLFKVDEDVATKSNLYLKLVIAHDEENDTLMQQELENSLFVYLEDGLVDTLVHNDSVRYYVSRTDFVEDVLSYRVPFIRKGKIRLVNAKGEQLLDKPIQDFAVYADLLHEDKYGTPTGDVYTEGYIPTGIKVFYSFCKSELRKYDYRGVMAIGLPELQSKDILFKQDGKWGFLNMDRGVIIDPIYDSYTYGRNIRFFNHGVLAAIVDAQGNYLFQVDNKILSASNHYMEYLTMFQTDMLNLAEEELKHSFYLYLSKSVIDTLHINDTIWEYDSSWKKEVDIKYIPQIKEGQISIVNAKGKLLYEHIDMLALLAEYYEEDPFYKDFYYDIQNKYTLVDSMKFIELGPKADVKSNQLNFYAFDQLLISSKLAVIQSKGKYGLIDLQKGIILEPQYDSYWFDGMINFGNNESKKVSFDLNGKKNE